MYSDRPEHVRAYEDWMGGVEGKQVPYDQCGQMVMVKVPTQAENLRFFFSYQINFMYWRYFMWNLPAARTTYKVMANWNTVTG